MRLSGDVAAPRLRAARSAGGRISVGGPGLLTEYPVVFAPDLLIFNHGTHTVFLIKRLTLGHHHEQRQHAFPS